MKYKSKEEYTTEEKLIAWLRFNELLNAGEISFVHAKGIDPKNAYDLFTHYSGADVYTAPNPGSHYVPYEKLFDKKYSDIVLREARNQLDISLTMKECAEFSSKGDIAKLMLNLGQIIRRKVGCCFFKIHRGN